MIRGIAFDFDGVLVESVDVKTRAYARSLRNMGRILFPRRLITIWEMEEYPDSSNSGPFIAKY